jgi:hypothetical protein
MANKRDLKSAVNNITSVLFTECIINKDYVPGADKNKATELMAKILKINNDFIPRISHPEPGCNVKSFYKKLRNDFNNAIDDVAKEVDELCKKQTE